MYIVELRVFFRKLVTVWTHTLKNPNIAIGNGYEEAFTEQYRGSKDDTDVTVTISWIDE